MINTIKLVLVIVTFVILTYYYDIEKFTGINIFPTKNDPFMNNTNPVLKRLPDTYTKEEHNEVESKLYNGIMFTEPEEFYNTKFSRNFETEPSDDQDAYREFLGYNKSNKIDSWPEKSDYIYGLVR